MHQDKFKVSFYKSVGEIAPTNYSYRRDWSTGRNYFITYKGNDFKRFDTSDEMFTRLDELRKMEKIDDL